MLAQHARRTRLKTSDSGAPLAEVVDGRLAQHGIDTEKISWDAYRREDGTWRVVATWPSGKATAQAIWELDKARQHVAPHGAHPAMCVADPRAEEEVEDAGQDRVSDVPVVPRHRARLDVLHPVTHHELVTALEPLDEARNVLEVIGQVGVGHHDVLAAR